MTQSFAAAVTTTVPILALAAGAEARAIRERLRRPDEAWEKNFAAYHAENELDMTKTPAEMLAYFRNVPAISKLFVVTRLLTIVGAMVWLAVFVLLALAELLGLLWLGDGAQQGDSSLAVFCVTVVAIALAAVIMAPAVYLLVPLLMPLDLVPEGLKKAVGPKLASPEGQGWMRLFFSEFEGAANRAAERLKEQVQAGLTLIPANQDQARAAGAAQSPGGAQPPGGA